MSHAIAINVYTSFQLFIFHILFFLSLEKQTNRSSLRLMGTEPLNAVAAKHLPSADVVSPPEAVFMIAVDSSTAAHMPQFQNLVKSGIQAQILHSDGGY